MIKDSTKIGAVFLIGFGWAAIFVILISKLFSNQVLSHPIYQGNQEISFQRGTYSKNFWDSALVRSVNDNCFYPDSWNILDGYLTLKVNKESVFCDGIKHLYKGDLVSSRVRFSPPFRATARMKVASGPGIVSAFFTYTDPLDGSPHVENDFEFPGGDVPRTAVWLNMYHPGTDPSLGDARYLPIEFDATAEFAEYTLEVGTQKTVWRINGKPIRTEINPKSPPPQTVVFNSWFAHVWGGVFDKAKFADEDNSPFEVESVKIVSGEPL